MYSDMSEGRTRGRLHFIIDLLTILAATAAIFGLISCAQDPQEQMLPPSVPLIATRPNDYVGRLVALTGSVRYIHRHGVFTIADVQDSPPDVLVIGNKPGIVTPELQQGQVVRITGVVQTYTPEIDAQLAPAYEERGPLVGTPFVAVYQGRPVIVAETIERLEWPPPQL